ncbi:MAG: hypothetical protein QXW39_06375 [Candidatus Bathyarchaeia archaeon]
MTGKGASVLLSLFFERDAIPGRMEFATRNGRKGCGCVSENQ